MAEIRCAIGTLVLLVRGRLHMPTGSVGRTIGFADGTTSQIYRETVIDAVGDPPLVILAVRFRLRLLGTNRVAHALFRLESLLNTLLFAAHRGFVSKLWCTDLHTGFYRGLYEWKDDGSAIEYAETLRVVLRPWVEDGSFAYLLIPGVSRTDFLDGLAHDQGVGSGLWWLPVRSSSTAARAG